MTDTPTTQVADLIQRVAVDPDGDKIGTISDVYLDDTSGQPGWFAVTTGFFGTKVSFVPVAGASFVGEDVMVAYSKQQVKDAPNADADGHLDPDEEAALFAHYGTGDAVAATDVDLTDDVDVEGRTVGSDTSGATTDEAMTRSEEEVDVSTRSTETGRVRLRKWVETEQVQITVPVRTEKARLVTEPITDANVDDALAGPDLSDEEHEVILHEEVIDVDKRVVPKERVRLETDVETSERTVDEEVRKERIELVQDADADAGGDEPPRR